VPADPIVNLKHAGRNHSGLAALSLRWDASGEIAGRSNAGWPQNGWGFSRHLPAKETRSYRPAFAALDRHVVDHRHSPGKGQMIPDLNPIEARGGVISGRIVTVLIVSTTGALLALSALWWFFHT
jgi:hypothetical protein